MRTATESKSRAGVAERLNTLLADEFVLHVKARNFHWNVVAPNFKELHAYFEEIYEKQGEIADEVAERVRALGAPARGSMKAYIALTSLKESPENLTAKQMLETLAADLDAVCRRLREDIDFAEASGDPSTTDFLTGLLETHEKQAWMTRSFLG